MIVSSLRPLGEHPEIDRNQLRAHASWLPLCDEILYFGKPEPTMQTPKTRFFASEQFPRIASLALASALSGESCCLVNADIVLAEHTQSILMEVVRRRGVAAVSRRYEFLGENVNQAKLVNGDWGLDFFFASRKVWMQLARTIPETYRIGHSGWDTYVLSFFNTVARSFTWDITKRRCVLHPKHSERKRVHHVEIKDDEYTMRPGLPFQRL